MRSGNAPHIFGLPRRGGGEKIHGGRTAVRLYTTLSRRSPFHRLKVLTRLFV